MSVRESIDPRSSLWAWLAFDVWFYRSQRGLSLAQVGKIAKVARSTVSNWEAARLRPKEDQMRALDRAWDTGGHFERLLYFARTGHDPDWFKQYIQYEKNASIIKVYQGKTIPVPLETVGYAKGLLATGAGARDIEGALELRMNRQEELLNRADPPTLWILIDESVLDCPVGGIRVMHEQLSHLLELSRLPNVFLRVVPTSLGAHPGFDGPFQILTIKSRSIAYAGAQIGGRLIEAGPEVENLSVRFDEIAAEALARTASRSLIEQKMARFHDHLAEELS